MHGPEPQTFLGDISVLADSRLGWEASMGYYGGRDQLRWKLERMRKLYGIVDEEVR